MFSCPQLIAAQQTDFTWSGLRIRSLNRLIHIYYGCHWAFEAAVGATSNVQPRRQSLVVVRWPHYWVSIWMCCVNPLVFKSFVCVHRWEARNRLPSNRAPRRGPYRVHSVSKAWLRRGNQVNKLVSHQMIWLSGITVIPLEINTRLFCIAVSVVCSEVQTVCPLFCNWLFWEKLVATESRTLHRLLLRAGTCY